MTKKPHTPLLSNAELLELSMSVGLSFNFKQNSKAFIECLKKLLHFTSCEIWFLENSNARNFSKVHRDKKDIICTSVFEKKHKLAKFEKNQLSQSYVIKPHNKGILEGFTNLTNGIIYTFKLSDTVLLIAHGNFSTEQNLTGSFSILEPIFKRFNVSLQQSYNREQPDLLESKVLIANEELQKYKLVVDNVSEGLVIFNKNLEVVFVNEQFSKLSEYPIEETVGKPLQNLNLNRIYLPFIKKMFEKVFNGERVSHTLEHIKKVSKKNWWVSGTLSPYKNTKGEIVGAIAILRDITLEKLAEEAAIESQGRYNLIINNGFDGVLLYDLKNKIMLSVNKALLKNFGYTREEFLPIKIADAAPPTQSNGISSSVYLDQINDKIEKEGKFNYEWIHKKKDGSLFYVEIVAVRLLAPNDHIKIEIHKNITEKYHAQKILKDNENRLSKLFEMSPIPILIRSIKNKKFKQVNQRFIELFGYTLKEINAIHRDELVHWEDTKFINQNMKKLLSGEITSFKLEKQYIRKNGQIFWGAATRSLVEIDNELFIIGFVEDITDRKKAVEALRKSEAKVRSIFDSTADKIIALDGDLRLLDYNKSAENFMKAFYKDKSLKLGDTFAPINPKTGRSWTEVYKKALKGENFTLTREYQLNNEPVVDLVNIFPIKDDLQNIIGISLYGKDITELNKTQKALQKNEYQLKEAQRIAKTGNWEFNVLTEKLKWSEGTFRVFEIPPSTPYSNLEEYKKLVHPEDLSLLIKTIQATLSGGKSSFEIEIRHFTRSQKLIYSIIRGESIKKKDKPVKIFGTIQDITDLKKVELELIEFNNKYQDLFDNMYDALLVTDENGFFIDANKAGQRLLEYSLEELKLLRIPDIVHPDDNEKSLKYLEKLNRDGYYSNYQGRVFTKTGDIKYLQVNSNAIIKDGKMIGSRDIARDITDLKIAEKKREQLFTELETVNNELKDFAYIVSHDLKAPLRAISSLSGWILEDYKDLFDDEGREHLELLVGRANRMQKFIEGILEYSRLGRIKVERNTVDIKKLIYTIIDSLDPPKHFTIKVQSNIPRIKCEEIRIHQVFQNLISNAIKYNDKNAAIISIHYRDIGAFHEFTVEDNGPGIEEKHFEKIFKIFQTLQSRDLLESTGIGLTIVKRIIELHGGNINLSATLGKGSKFSFTILK